MLAQGIENTFGNLTPPDVQRFASVGTFASNASNAQRDLLATENLKSINLVTPKPFVIQAWVLNHSSGLAKLEKQDISIFLPHEWVQALFKHGFSEAVFGDSNDCQKFWSHVDAKDPKLHKNEMLKVDGWQRKFQPMIIHADKDPHNKHDSIHTTHMYSLSAVDLQLAAWH